jgi:hypothetical protein
MADRVAGIITDAHLGALLEELQKNSNRLYLQMRGFDEQIMVLKELIRHPPPHPDPDAFRQHIAGRIKEISEIIEKLRALLPPELRGG